MSAAGLIGLGINTVIVGFFSGVIGYLIDFINGQTAFANLAYGTLNTMNYITWMVWIFPFTFLFMNCLNYIITSANEASGWA